EILINTVVALAIFTQDSSMSTANSPAKAAICYITGIILSIFGLHLHHSGLTVTKGFKYNE
ncbi:hypothetical protein ABEB36_011166, partial [Hypothenemus hampei]